MPCGNVSACDSQSVEGASEGVGARTLPGAATSDICIPKGFGSCCSGLCLLKGQVLVRKAADLCDRLAVLVQAEHHVQRADKACCPDLPDSA